MRFWGLRMRWRISPLSVKQAKGTFSVGLFQKQYAITWFLIAVAMAGVYLAYHWETGRLEIGGRRKADQ